MILIATPTEAYHNEKGLNLVQKHITQLGGSFEVQTYTVKVKDKEGKEKEVERRRLRITADTTVRTAEGKDGKKISRQSAFSEIRWYLETQYLWKVVTA